MNYIYKMQNYRCELYIWDEIITYATWKSWDIKQLIDNIPEDIIRFFSFILSIINLLKYT